MNESEGVGLLKDLLTPRREGDRPLHVNLIGGNTWLAWVSCTCCLICLTVAVLGSVWLISDRAEIREQLRARQAGENAIRAYINTGRLKPQEEKSSEQ